MTFGRAFGQLSNKSRNENRIGAVDVNVDVVVRFDVDVDVADVDRFDVGVVG